ncbi:MAG: Flagellar protein FlaG [Candidatus Nitrospira kreftii]|uniref:Flagellar protein FlaG n=1 Tax=Candidatus Nitrospira kreftii TaxID=2652173 RepID=A0A7S8FFG6_9BACT|nr:MAG: Flagellar protein FlaG [Candidatus Nitrospira kreftii]
MITNVTSKVNLPDTASRSSQLDTPSRHERLSEHPRGSDFTFTSPADRVALEHAVSKVRESFQQSGSRLQIEVDPDLKRVVVKILNGESGEVIRQIPPQEVIDLAKNLSGPKGLLLGEHV